MPKTKISIIMIIVTSIIKSKTSISQTLNILSIESDECFMTVSVIMGLKWLGVWVCWNIALALDSWEKHANKINYYLTFIPIVVYCWMYLLIQNPLRLQKNKTASNSIFEKKTIQLNPYISISKTSTSMSEQNADAWEESKFDWNRMIAHGKSLSSILNDYDMWSNIMYFLFVFKCNNGIKFQEIYIISNMKIKIFIKICY